MKSMLSEPLTIKIYDTIQPFLKKKFIYKTTSTKQEKEKVHYAI